MQLNLAKNKPSSSNREPYSANKLPELRQKGQKISSSKSKNKPPSSTKLPSIIKTPKNELNNTSRHIFESSISIFGEKLQQIRSENSTTLTVISSLIDATKNQLRKETMNLYRQKYD